jgi:GAF domain-containing protein
VPIIGIRNDVHQHSESSAQSLTGLLSAVVADLRQASGADIVFLVLYDEDSHRYYAPFAIGLPEEGLAESISDLNEQLARYESDVATGKVPDELHVHQYGSTVWLTVTRQPLVAMDAQAEVDSTFVRRQRIASTIGLPLLDDDRLLGIVYLDFKIKDEANGAKGTRTPDPDRISRLKRRATRVAQAISDALAEAERAALEGMRRLTHLLSVPTASDGAAPGDLHRQLSIALSDILLASDLDAALIYQRRRHGRGFELVSANAPTAAPFRINAAEDPERLDEAVVAEVTRAMSSSRLHPAFTTRLGTERGVVLGYLIALSRDRLAPVRRAPAIEAFLQGASDLIAGALANHELIAELENGNRLLGALARMTNAMLRPGASRRQVLEAVVSHLTDDGVPEFDFHFAAVYLIDEAADGGLVVRMAAGSSITPAVNSAIVGEERIPSWVVEQQRALATEDVLAYVARTWNVVVVGAAPRPDEPEPEELLTGYPEDQVRSVTVPVLRRDGTVVATIPAVLLGQSDGRPPSSTPPFTLAGDIFESSGHAELMRIFVPFGLDRKRRATGVLEVGYHRSSARGPDRTQVEALRAAASQVAIAVDTARLYEEARRHGEQLELMADVSQAIASSIDLDQTLRLAARNLARLVDASICQIALYEEDGSGWYGAAATDQEAQWERMRGERSERSFLFDVLDSRRPIVIEDVRSSELVPRAYAETFGIRSLLAVPLMADGRVIGAAILGQRGETRRFTAEEMARAQGLAHQAAIAIQNARLHALAEEERHIQKDFVLIGFGQWGQKAYQHLLTLKQFFNFRIHVVDRGEGQPEEELERKEQAVVAHGDAFYRDTRANPAEKQLAEELDTSCYTITYIATPAPTHLPMLARYYRLSDVMVVEKPLGASPEAYRRFLDSAPGRVEIVAADHYYFKLEVRLLQLLLTEERTLRAFLDSVEEISIEILEEKPLTGAAAEIGVVADLIPHAFAIVSLFTPIDHIRLDPQAPLLIGRHEPLVGEHETYARMNGTFPYRGRTVRLVIDVGKGVSDTKCIELRGERRSTSRSSFYRFDFARGEAIDGTQANVRAAVRKIREPGVPDNAHLNMLRHVIEKRHPAVGILSIREAIRSNARIRELEEMAQRLLEGGEWSPYPLGTRPAFAEPPAPVIDGEDLAPPEPRSLERERASHT